MLDISMPLYDNNILTSLPAVNCHNLIYKPNFNLFERVNKKKVPKKSYAMGLPYLNG